MKILMLILLIALAGCRQKAKTLEATMAARVYTTTSDVYGWLVWDNCSWATYYDGSMARPVCGQETVFHYFSTDAETVPIPSAIFTAGDYFKAVVRACDDSNCSDNNTIETELP